MLICEKCNRLVYENEAPRVRQTHSVDTGVGYRTLFEEYYLENCNCGGKFVTATKCVECGEYFNPTSYFDDICEQCLKGVAYDKADVN